VADERRERIREADARSRRGGPEKYHERLATSGKLFVRRRVELLCDEGSFIEDGLLANAGAEDLAADGVVTGRAMVDRRTVWVIANDPTVKAGSWGARTVEKIVRVLESAYDEMLPVFYLVDSAGARITDQVELFPGRRGAGRIFYNQVRLSGRVPQICCLFGPSAAGGAYIPAFCDVVVMVEGRASMYLGSPRMAEMVVGEITTRTVSIDVSNGSRVHIPNSDVLNGVIVNHTTRGQMRSSFDLTVGAAEDTRLSRIDSSPSLISISLTSDSSSNSISFLILRRSMVPIPDAGGSWRRAAPAHSPERRGQ